MSPLPISTRPSNSLVDRLSDSGNANRNLALAAQALFDSDLNAVERYQQISEHLERFSNSPYSTATQDIDDLLFRTMTSHLESTITGSTDSSEMMYNNLLLNEINIGYEWFGQVDLEDRARYDEIDGTTLSLVRTASDAGEGTDPSIPKVPDYTEEFTAAVHTVTDPTITERTASLVRINGGRYEGPTREDVVANQENSRVTAVDVPLTQRPELTLVTGGSAVAYEAPTRDEGIVGIHSASNAVVGSEADRHALYVDHDDETTSRTVIPVTFGNYSGPAVVNEGGIEYDGVTEGMRVMKEAPTKEIFPVEGLNPPKAIIPLGVGIGMSREAAELYEVGAGLSSRAIDDVLEAAGVGGGTVVEVTIQDGEIGSEDRTFVDSAKRYRRSDIRKGVRNALRRLRPKRRGFFGKTVAIDQLVDGFEDLTETISYGANAIYNRVTAMSAGVGAVATVGLGLLVAACFGGDRVSNVIDSGFHAAQSAVGDTGTSDTGLGYSDVSAKEKLTSLEMKIVEPDYSACLTSKDHALKVLQSVGLKEHPFQRGTAYKRTSGFGERTIKGKKSNHFGTDLGAAEGTSIYAPGDGQAAYRKSPFRGTGNLVAGFTLGDMEVGPNGEVSFKKAIYSFMHLSEASDVIHHGNFSHDQSISSRTVYSGLAAAIDVNEGEEVGKVGHTGRVVSKKNKNGDHLHAEFYVPKDALRSLIAIDYRFGSEIGNKTKKADGIVYHVVDSDMIFSTLEYGRDFGYMSGCADQLADYSTAILMADIGTSYDTGLIDSSGL